MPTHKRNLSYAVGVNGSRDCSRGSMHSKQTKKSSFWTMKTTEWISSDKEKKRKSLFHESQFLRRRKNQSICIDRSYSSNTAIEIVVIRIYIFHSLGRNRLITQCLKLVFFLRFTCFFVSVLNGASKSSEFIIDRQLKDSRSYTCASR